MFESYFLVKLAHILLFVYWLGGDIGVFHSSSYVRNAALTREARGTALKILLWVDMIPRYCLVLMLPVGYTLAMELGIVSVSSTVAVGMWVIALIWLALVYAVHHFQGTPLGQRLRIVLARGLVGDAVQGFRGMGHIDAPWLSAKFLVFAFLIFCGIMIHVVGAPSLPALREVLANGSTPELEATIK